MLLFCLPKIVYMKKIYWWLLPFFTLSVYAQRDHSAWGIQSSFSINNYKDTHETIWSLGGSKSFENGIFLEGNIYSNNLYIFQKYNTDLKSGSAEKGYLSKGIGINLLGGWTYHNFLNMKVGGFLESDEILGKTNSFSGDETNRGFIISLGIEFKMTPVLSGGVEFTQYLYDQNRSNFLKSRSFITFIFRYYFKKQTSITNE